MKTPDNQVPIKKIVISASYNSYDQLSSDEKVIKEAEKYRHMARQVHKIYRFPEAIDSKVVDNLKFLYPIAGVPVIGYALVNAMHTSAKKIGLVGSYDIGEFLEIFKYLFPFEKNRFTFIHEGTRDELSLTNTFRRAYSAMKPDKDEPILFLPGDSPFFSGLESLLHDKDARDNNVVLDFNTQENFFSSQTEALVFSRTFHHTFMDYDGENRDVHIKEPNAYILNLAHFEEKGFWDLFDEFYESRKAGGLNPMGVVKMIWASTKSPRRLANLVHAGAIVLSQMKSLKRRDIDYHKVQKLADLLLDTKVLLKADHTDINRLNDVDSYEDHQMYEGMIDLAKTVSMLNDIYPHFKEIVRLRIGSTGLLNPTISMAYLNHRREMVGMQRLYAPNGQLIISDDFDEQRHQALMILERDYKK